MSLFEKNVLFVGWGAENSKDTYMYQIYYMTLKEIFPKISVFDTKKNFLKYGGKKMNQKLIQKISRKKYHIILFAVDHDELYLETIKTINKLDKLSKKILIVCDDDARFESHSRYFGLFFDAIITSQDYVQEYKKNNIKNVYYHMDYNTYKLSPINSKKKYDVTFIGRPKGDRHEILEYLLDKGINIKLFGWGWHKFKKLRKIYQGPLNAEDYAKVINQTKINLNFTKAGYFEESGHYNMKGRFFEVALCSSFQLIEDFPTIHKFFTPKKEIDIFYSKEDLFKKIKYYLKNEHEREKIAKKSYEKTIKNYNRKEQLIKIFKKILKQKKNLFSIPREKKIKILDENDLNLNKDILMKKLKNIEYISFKIGNPKFSEYKTNLQIYSLNLSKKNISCTEMYIRLDKDKNYLLFTPKFAFKRVGKKINQLINFNQLVVRKDYFLKNIKSFQDKDSKSLTNLITLENTEFILIPMVSVEKTNILEFEIMKKSYEMCFIYELLYRIYNKKILIDSYIYKLLLRIFSGEFFILRYILESLLDKSNKEKWIFNKNYMKKKS